MVAAPVGGIWDRLNLPLSLPMGDWDPIRRDLAIAASPSLPHVQLPAARAVSHKAAPSAEEARFAMEKGECVREEQVGGGGKIVSSTERV